MALSLACPGWAADGVGARGATHTTVDLLRPYSDFPKIFVQAELPDGSLGTFLVDTGADISAVTQRTAERLGLPLSEQHGLISGISDATEVHFATIPWVRFGDAVSVSQVEVAVDLPGVQDQVDMMPVDGILGNNVWENFTLELDYRANTMTLHLPGSVRLPRSAVAMEYHSGHAQTVVEFTTEAHPDTPNSVVLALDTGANEVILLGANGLGFEGDYTVGLEPVLGVTTSEVLPASALLRKTRRIPLSEVKLGGTTVDVDFDARWLDFDRDTASRLSLRGLVGHDLFEDQRVWFDFQGGRFAIRPSPRRADEHNGHDVLLQQDIAAYGDDPSRQLYRARLHVGLGDFDAAEALLRSIVDDGAGAAVAEARVLIARIRRIEGDLDGAWAVLSPMGVVQLLDEDEFVAVVNGLLLEGRTAEAEALSAEALRDAPDRGATWVAQADVLLHAGRVDEANDALVTAAKLAQNPDAHLLRRARVALARGDHDGALTMLRSGVQLNPLDGKFLWFYAQLATPEDHDMVRYDIDRAEEQTHPQLRPLDFLLGARTHIGDTKAAEDLLAVGLERDCSSIRGESAADNCRAWYYMLAGMHLDEAQRLVDGAIASEGSRSDFLDTKAMVHLARGELSEALDAATRAARLSPADPYMLWQAERIATRQKP